VTLATSSRVDDKSSPNKGTELTRCRGCGEPLVHEFVDLGMSPLCESFLLAEQLNTMEPFYPLRVLVCDSEV
jgi:hypothetical protein